MEPEFVLDEGSAIIDGIIPGVAAPVAMIGIGEKGYLTLQLTSPGSVAIPRFLLRNAIGIVSRAIDKLETTPFPEARQRRGKEFFNFVGPELSWDRNLARQSLAIRAA